MNQNTCAGGTDTAWRGLYKAGGVAALLVALLFRRNWAAEVFLLKELGVLKAGPATWPETVADWFQVLHDSPFLGMVMFDVLDLANFALVGLVYLALCGALRRVAHSAMLTAGACGLLGVGVYFATNQSFAMLGLSETYAAASTGAQRAAALAAGEALLVIHQQSAGLYLSLFLTALAGLIISIVMLRSRVFSRATGWLGLVPHTLLLIQPAVLIFAPAWAAIPPASAALFLLVWNILVAVRLLRLGSRAPEEQNT